MIETSSQSRSTRLELVTREQHGGTAARALDEDVGEDVDRDRVEARERLVEDQRVGLVYERRRELDTLLVAEREGVDSIVSPLLHAEASVQRSAAAAASPPDAVQAREVHELLVDGMRG